MPSFPARTVSSPDRSRIRSALVGFADEVCGTLARLIAYAMVLALIAIGGIALWRHLPEIAEAAASKDWTQSVRMEPNLADNMSADGEADAGHPRLRGGL